MAKEIVRCQFCDRPLTDPASIARECGPECADKLQAQLSAVSTARRALANGYKDSVLKGVLDRLRVAEEYKKIGTARGWDERRMNRINKDIRNYRSAIEHRVNRLAMLEEANEIQCAAPRMAQSRPGAIVTI